MGVLALNLPLPVLNGPGAAVDCSALGGPRTITCLGTFQGALITIEVSNDGGATFSPLCSFQGVGGEKVVPVAAQWMRVNVSGRGSKPWLPFAANIDVAGPDSGSTFAALPMPALNGGGAQVAADAFENFCTFVCTGAFPGASVAVQISEDGVDWATLVSFNGRGGVVSRAVSAAFMRAFASGLESAGGITLSVGSTAIGGGGSGDVVPTDGGEAGLTGAGTAPDPIIPVAGPFRPVTDIFVMDDYLVAYGPLTAGVPSVEGVGYTSILRTAGVTTQFSCNLAAGPLGPGVGSMMGVMDLQLIGANANQFITAVQFRPGDDSGFAIDTSRLEGDWDLWFGARVSFEGLNNFEASQRAWAGFYGQIDQPSFGVREGAYFHPRFNGVQVNWFAFYRFSDDTGIVTADVDTGVRVGFTAAHPADARAAQNLVVRVTGPDATAALNMYIDGVRVVGPIALQNPASTFTAMCALESLAAAQSNTMYVDWMLWGLTGRTV